MSEPIRGCTNPSAKNYDPAATQDDGSCLYVLRHNGGCYGFADTPLPEEESFTVSYSILGNAWVFYHDYIPDFYFHTRNRLYSVKGNQLYKHNEGASGVFYEDNPASFFIDVVFPSKLDFQLHTVTWITELLNAVKTEQFFGTLTHISAWNAYQHSGRIPLAQVWEELAYKNIRRTKGEWSFNDFLNILQENPGEFLSSIFQNFLLNPGAIDNEAAWYDKAPLEDKWVCIRFEYDNSIDNTLLLHEANITGLNSDR
jgi:hypothetical protein